MEYRVVSLLGDANGGSKELTDLAWDGWRVVACAHVSGQGLAVIMCREKPFRPVPIAPPEEPR